MPAIPVDYASTYSQIGANVERGAQNIAAIVNAAAKGKNFKKLKDAYKTEIKGDFAAMGADYNPKLDNYIDSTTDSDEFLNKAAQSDQKSRR